MSMFRDIFERLFLAGLCLAVLFLAVYELTQSSCLVPLSQAEVDNVRVGGWFSACNRSATCPTTCVSVCKYLSYSISTPVNGQNYAGGCRHDELASHGGSTAGENATHMTCGWACLSSCTNG